ncbi:MAG: RNA pseudouridine synthase [Paludibacteraceae bacterium]|nr:RNA pseudouridine synthase [Paludibacteraceae bacterium]
MFHPLVLCATAAAQRPLKFTCPLCYEPHPWVLQAAETLQLYLSAQNAWQAELQRGKMFGVLVVSDAQDRIGFLAAFSGTLQSGFQHDYFVPPVYDYLKPDGEFAQGTARLAAMKRQLEALQQSNDLSEALANYQALARRHEAVVASYQQRMQQHKAERDRQRQSGGADESALIRQSQFEKAELKRLKQQAADELATAHAAIGRLQAPIARLRDERKRLSEELQNWLFAQYRLRNALGEERSLAELFAHRRQAAAPAGAGDCAAPKLLQYAYLHHYTPLAMGEFWWGQSPVGELREHGRFYPACQSKCAPILSFMLQGLDVEANPLESAPDTSLKICYEDDWLLVIDKPSGMLSVPGLLQQQSAETLLQQRYGSQLKAVHRLDLGTSGLLVLAKDAATYKALQAQFAQRRVHKTYTAVIEGRPQQTAGEIRLPLRPNPDDRPRQTVDFEHGKPAVTRYRTIESTENQTRLELQPLTGRTHQLRLHCAHPQGLGCPIVGDRLYGHPAERLLLHCTSLSFTHPQTGNPVSLDCPPPF